MPDPFTPEQRHRCMASIHSTDTKPERIVRRFLFACGMRFRINVRKLPGTPDIVMRKYRTVVFVNGCFWHGHERCKFFRMPRTHTPFWEKKICRNKERDRQNERELRERGWNVVVIWECELKRAHREQTLTNLYTDLQRAFISRFTSPSYAVRGEEKTLPMAAEEAPPLRSWRKEGQGGGNAPIMCERPRACNFFGKISEEQAEGIGKNP